MTTQNPNRFAWLVRSTSFLQLVRSELSRIVSRPLNAVALIALMCVPLLYGGMYLWANKDPENNLQDVPAALVVLDDGGMVDGEYQNLGEEVADELIADGSLHWVRVDDTTALHGVERGDYEFALTLPHDFTDQLTSAATETPTQAAFQLTTNDANNYLGTRIARTVSDRLIASISSRIGEEAAAKMLFGLNSAHDGFLEASNAVGTLASKLGEAADAAGQLADGAARLHDGTGQLREKTANLPGQAAALNDGATQLRDGAAQLADGTTTLIDGTDRLRNGISTLADGLNTLDEKVGALPGNVQQLADGAQQVADGNQLLREVADRIRDDVHGVLGLRDEVADALEQRLIARGLDPELVAAAREELAAIYDCKVAPTVNGAVDLLDEKVGKIDQLADGAQRVADGAATLSGATVQLADAVSTAANGAAQLRDGAAELRGGAGRLNEGAGGLRDGTAQLADGTSQLAQAAPQLADAIGQLDDGSGTLAEKQREFADALPQAVDGAGTIRDKLAEGADQLPSSTEELREQQAATIGEPVAMDRVAFTEAAGYGEGLAPFFLALGAWLGVFTIFLVIFPYSKRAVTAMRHPLAVTFAGWLVPAIIGVVEMSLLTLVLVHWVRLDFAWPWTTFFVLCASSFAFAAIFQALRIWLDSVGQFIGLLLMVLQLVAGGGTFPWQTLPSQLAWLHHWMPMSWSIDALRQTIYGGDPAIVWRSVAWLAVLGCIAFAVSFAGIARKVDARTLRDLRAPIIH